MKSEYIQKLVTELGAVRCAPALLEQISFDRSFRDMCALNSCGQYGKNYMCPPATGDIDELMALAQSFPCAVFYQSVYPLEDSFDFEGMMEAGKKHSELETAIQKRLLAEAGGERFLHLSGGGCHLCERCGILDDVPCRFPELALPPLEGYGVNVSATAGSIGLPYINGKDTVTYFGAVLFEE